MGSCVGCAGRNCWSQEVRTEGSVGRVLLVTMLGQESELF